MAVGFDATMLAGNSADGFNQEIAAATAISSTGITVGGSASLLVAVLSWGSSGGTAPASITMTWNGGAITAGPTINSGKVRAAIFYKYSPAAGANALAAAWTNSNDCYMSAVSLTGSDLVNGVVIADSQTATNTTTITVPSTTDGATVACFAVDGSTPTVNFTKIFAEANLNPGGGGSYTLGGTSNAHTFTGGGGSVQALVGIHVIAASGGGGRTLFYRSGLDGHSSSGPKQFNPSLGYHRHPALSLESYHRERAAAHREFMAKVARAA